MALDSIWAYWRKIDGIILGAECEKFALTREIMGLINHQVLIKCNQKAFTMDEIRRKKESVDNSNFEEFLNNKFNSGIMTA